MPDRIKLIEPTLLQADVEDTLEKYDGDGLVKQYHYQWKRIIPKEGIMYSHISAWENKPHGSPNTPPKYSVVTEPHHHHHIPGDRSFRQANYHYRSLKTVLNL